MTTNVTKSPDLSPDTCVRISPSVYVRSFGDELVLLDFGRGEYFGLDEIGGEIWRRLEAGDSLSRIADSIVERYAVEKETALRDIFDLVSNLSSQSLVTIAFSKADPT